MKKGIKIFLIIFCLLLLIGIGTFICISSFVKVDLKLLGDKNIKLVLNDEYKESGAVATLMNKDISSYIKINGDVDVTKVGTYEVTYSVKYKFIKDQKEEKRVINVVDEEKPSIELIGDAEVSLYTGSEYKESGAKALDNYDGDLTDKITIEGTVDTSKKGEYILTYNVLDSSNNEASVERKVIVKDKPVATVSSTGTGLPILMYHYFYDETKGETGKNANWMEIHDFEEQLQFLKDNDFYFPTWEEVYNFVLGEIELPRKSVVITIDDGHASFFEEAYPVINKIGVPVTSFIITSKAGGTKFKNYQSVYVTYQSHTDSMHTGGCTGGHGGLFRCISYEKGLADLNKSVSILGTSDALAYPYGDVTDSTKAIMKDAPFKVAVTTEYGKAKKGMEPLLLPRVRMSKGVSLKSFAASL